MKFWRWDLYISFFISRVFDRVYLFDIRNIFDKWIFLLLVIFSVIEFIFG